MYVQTNHCESISKYFSHYYGVLTPLQQWWTNLLSSRGLKCLVPFPACCQIGNWQDKGHKLSGLLFLGLLIIPWQRDQKCKQNLRFSSANKIHHKMSFYPDHPKIDQRIRLVGGQNGVIKASVENCGFPMYEIQRLFR